MPKGNFNNRTKRNRELAKKDKRAAKDEKRAQKKAEARAARAATDGAAPPRTAPVAMTAAQSNVRPPASSAVARWMNKKP
jgi:hypothetical protein